MSDMARRKKQRNKEKQSGSCSGLQARPQLRGAFDCCELRVPGLTGSDTTQHRKRTALLFVEGRMLWLFRFASAEWRTRRKSYLQHASSQL